MDNEGLHSEAEGAFFPRFQVITRRPISPDHILHLHRFDLAIVFHHLLQQRRVPASEDHQQPFFAAGKDLLQVTIDHHIAAPPFAGQVGAHMVGQIANSKWTDPKFQMGKFQIPNGQIPKFTNYQLSATNY